MAPESKSLPAQLRLTLGNERQIYRVTELNSAIQRLFITSFSQIWVSGEIAGCRTAASGHHYFCLKDADSQVKCVLFKNAGRLSRVKPQDGLAVAIQGNLEVYPARGEYQIIVDRLELQGSGSLQIAFEQLKARLAAEGLFDQSRKKQLPRFPKRIGIVTSSSGAVLHDILHILERRFPGLQIRLYPALVQGEGAVEQLCAALQHFSRSGWADVVILARGGGSIEDLWSFNDERLARTIAATAVPVISAVGHETDFTISDFVADLRAPTPSAAAEIVICTRQSLLLQLAELSARMLRSLQYRLMSLSRSVEARGGDRGVSLVRRTITRRMQQVDELEQALRTQQLRQLDLLRRKLAALEARLQETNLPLRFSRNRHRQELLTEKLSRTWRAAAWRNQQRLEVATSNLVQLSPLGVLARGYAIVEKPQRQVVRSAGEVAPEDPLAIRLHSGRIHAVVTSTEPAV